ncbi:MAG: quinone-dependent dihydroorotate dehydrogenase [Acidobacteriota bacterium]
MSYGKFLRPILFRLPAEAAHELGVDALKIALGTRVARRMAALRFAAETVGAVSLFGLQFHNPLGLAAGFDKNAAAVDQLAALGFGFIEVGTVTDQPQKGNPKPRLFRLPADRALINRLGFNNAGADAVAEKLGKIDRECIVGVNIGRNRTVPNEEAVENYLAAFEKVHPLADYIAVNVSSPNTPDLRDLQKSESLDALIDALQRRNLELGKKPLLLKISPDLAENELNDVVDICLERSVDGLIAANTTLRREGLLSGNHLVELDGGLSGRPLQQPSNTTIARIFVHSKGKLPVIGVGGIFSAQDAFDKIAAGASLLQAYTGFIYGGPSFAGSINRGLKVVLKQNGFASLSDAVGIRAGEIAILR